MNTRLRELRKEQGIKAETIYKSLGIKQSSYYYYETGERQLSPEVAVKIAPILKINWWELYDIED